MKTPPRKITIFELRRHRFGDMPPLAHWPDKSKPFRYEESEVCRWLAEIEPSIPLARLFQQAYSAQAIIYDKNTGLWRGSYFGLTAVNRPPG